MWAEDCSESVYAVGGRCFKWFHYPNDNSIGKVVAIYISKRFRIHWLFSWRYRQVNVEIVCVGVGSIVC